MWKQTLTTRQADRYNTHTYPVHTHTHTHTSEGESIFISLPLPFPSALLQHYLLHHYSSFSCTLLLRRFLLYLYNRKASFIHAFYFSFAFFSHYNFQLPFSLLIKLDDIDLSMYLSFSIYMHAERTLLLFCSSLMYQLNAAYTIHHLSLFQYNYSSHPKINCTYLLDSHSPSSN